MFTRNDLLTMISQVVEIQKQDTDYTYKTVELEEQRNFSEEENRTKVNATFRSRLSCELNDCETTNRWMWYEDGNTTEGSSISEILNGKFCVDDAIKVVWFDDGKGFFQKGNDVKVAKIKFEYNSK